jgi:hypothetical protein
LSIVFLRSDVVKIIDGRHKVKEHIIADCRELSGGTMANLTGINKYDYVEFIQCRFVEYVANDTDECFETWLDAWKSFRESGAYFNVLRELDTQIKTKENAMNEQKEAAVTVAIEAIEQATANQENAMTEQTAAEVETAEVETVAVAEPHETTAEETRDGMPPCVKQFFQDLDVTAIKNNDAFKVLWTKFCAEHASELQDGDENIDGYRQEHIPLTVKNVKVPVKKNIYDRIMIAASKDQTRKHLSGFLITEDGKQIVSTDGRRLAILPYNGDLLPGIWKPIKDNKILSALMSYTYEEYLRDWKLFHDEKNPLPDEHPLRKNFNIGFAMTTMEPFNYADGMWFENVFGTYPDYTQVIPEDKDLSGTVDHVETFYSAFKTAQRFYDKLSGFAMDGLGTCLRCKEDCYVHMNYNFMVDGLEILGGEDGECKLHYADKLEENPLVLRRGNGVYVVMPISSGDTTKPMYTVINDLVLPQGVQPAVQTRKPGNSKPSNRGNGGSGGSKVNPATKAIRTAPTAPVDADKSKAAIAARKPVPVNDDGSISPTERVLKNLAFKQLMRFGKDVHIDARKDVIHKLFDAGKLAVSEYMDKKGKQHYLVAKQFMGDIAHKYARYLLNGGQKFDFSPVEG